MKRHASSLQPTSPPPSSRRIILTLMPFFTTVEERLTFRSLIKMTASASASALPFASLMTAPASLLAPSEA
jgi:hypothetical protein